MEVRGISQRKMADKIGMTYSGFWRSLSRNTIKSRDVELMAEILHVSVGTLYGEPAVSDPDPAQINKEPKICGPCTCGLADCLRAVMDGVPK